MRLIFWEDERGWRHRSAVRDSDPDDFAQYGVYHDPPCVDDLDWDNIKRDLHNALVDRRLFEYSDITKQQDGIPSAILSVLRRRVIELYRQRRATPRRR